MYLTVGWGGGKFKPSKGVVQLEYESMYRKGQADPDNQRPDKWSSTAFFFNLKLVCLLSPYKGESGEWDAGRRLPAPMLYHPSCSGDLAF